MSTWAIIRPEGGNGAAEFRGQGRALARWLRTRGHDPVDVVFDQGLRWQMDRANQVLGKLRDLAHRGNTTQWYEPVRATFLCHGWTSGIQAGFNVRQPDKLLALAQLVTGRVMLYCCSTAGGPGHMGDGGFADRLRDLTGLSVWGHVGPGHCTRRPYVRCFDPPAGVGGVWWVVPPQTPGMDGTGASGGYSPAGWREWCRQVRTERRWWLVAP